MNTFDIIITSIFIFVVMLFISTTRLVKDPSGASYSVETKKNKVTSIISYLLVNVLIILILIKFILEEHNAIGAIVIILCFIYIMSKVWRSQILGLKELFKKDFNNKTNF